MNSHKKAFTLIELLVVIAIIGILFTIVLESTSAAQANARDATRIANMREVQIDLAQYYEAERSYPTEGSDNYSGMITLLKSVLTDTGDLPAKDPSGGSYGYISTGTSYCLGAHVEVTANIPSDNFSCLNGYNYSVFPPQ